MQFRVSSAQVPNANASPRELTGTPLMPATFLKRLLQRKQRRMTGRLQSGLYQTGTSWYVSVRQSRSVQSCSGRGLLVACKHAT